MAPCGGSCGCRPYDVTEWSAAAALTDQWTGCVLTYCVCECVGVGGGVGRVEYVWLDNEVRGEKER